MKERSREDVAKFLSFVYFSLVCNLAVSLSLSLSLLLLFFVVVRSETADSCQLSQTEVGSVYIVRIKPGKSLNLPGSCR